MMESSTSRTGNVCAVVSLTLGILGWALLALIVIVTLGDTGRLIGFVAALLCSLGAIMFAHRGRAAIRSNPETRGRQMALAGLLLGWSALAALIVFVFFVLTMFLQFVLFLAKLSG